MKTLMIGLIVLATFSAHASMLETKGPLDDTFSKAEKDAEMTHFETLGDLFKSGTLPNLSKISNIAWAGRCFVDSNPNQPTNAGYIIRQKRNDAGPIAAGSKAYEAFSYWHIHQAPNFYDAMDISQIFSLYGEGLEARDVKVNDDSIEIAVTTEETSSLKVSGDYLVEEISRAAVEDVATIRCYYFIPDLNN